MKKRRTSRTVIQENRRNKRIKPYSDQTPLRFFINKESYGALNVLLEELHRYLQDEDVDISNWNKLYFDFSKFKKGEDYHKVVIDSLATFIDKVQKEGSLKYHKSILYRYLASPEHCNLQIAETSWKTLISKAIREKN